MIGLHADSQDAPLSHSVAAECYISDLSRRQHEVLVAHQFGYGGGNFRYNCPAKVVKFLLASGIVENELAELAHCHASYWLKRLFIEAFQDEPGDLVVGWVNQGLPNNLIEADICETAFCGNSFLLCTRGQARQLIAGFFFISLGKQLAEIGEAELLRHENSHCEWRVPQKLHVTEKAPAATC